MSVTVVAEHVNPRWPEPLPAVEAVTSGVTAHSPTPLSSAEHRRFIAQRAGERLVSFAMRSWRMRVSDVATEL
jgi:hypothetical protein